jgi:23S rRNA (guanosine2251-2'-O)-methyltransferase
MALIYGINPVMEALKSQPDRIQRICVQRDQRNARVQQIIEVGRQRSLPLSFEDRSWLDRKCEGARHQGVICYVWDAPAAAVEDILDRAVHPGLVLVLDGIEDPHNFGAILRSAEIAGVDGVFVPHRRSSSLSPAAVKASAGAASTVRISRGANLAQLIDKLKEVGYWVAGLDAASGTQLWQADFTVPTALVLGSEGAGLHRLVKEKCDFLIRIPVRGRINSYNVSVAAGIALYEVIRQRAKK